MPQKVSVLFAFDGRAAFMTAVNGSQRMYDFVMPLTCTSATECEGSDVSSLTVPLGIQTR